MSQITNPDHNHRKARVLKSGLNALAGTVLFLIILVGLYWVAGKTQKRLDLTRDKIYTLSESTRAMLAKLQDRVTVTVYATEKDTPAEWTEKRDELRQLLAQYRNISRGKVQFAFRDPVPGTDTEKAAQDAGMESSLMQESSTTSFKLNQGYFGLVAEYRGKNEKIPFIHPSVSMEYQLTRAINKAGSVVLPKIALMTPAGNPLMGQGSNYTFISRSLTSEGFEVTELQPNEIKDLPKYDMAMIIDPQALEDEALFHIDQYVMNGGKLFVAAPGVTLNNRMGMNSVMPNPPAINTILETYGLRIDPNLVEDWQGANVQLARTRSGTMVQYKDPLVFVTSNRDQNSTITKDIKNMMFAYTSSVSPSDHGTSGTITPLVQSSEVSRVQEGQFTMESTELKPPTPEEKTSPKGLVMMVSGALRSHYENNPAPDLKNDDGTTRAVDVASIVKKSKSTATVIVAGSALFLVDQAVQQVNANLFLPLNAAEVLTRGSDMMSLRTREQSMATLREIKPSESMWTQVLIIGGIPVALVAFGLAKLMLNRRKKARYREIYARGA